MVYIEEGVCQYNKYGFCKYQNQCSKIHYKENCDNTCRDVKECPKRHPRPCKIYALNNICRFGGKCSYQHVHQPESEESAESSRKIQDLENSVKEMTKLIKHLEDELAEIKEITINKLSDVYDSSGTDRENKNELVCEYCEYRCKKSVKMKKHVSAKHSNSNEKCKECKEDFKCVQDLQLHMINDHAERTDKFVQIKKNNLCSICKKDFTTITKLCDHFQEKHVDGEKGSDCYQTNYGILFDLEKEKTKEDHDNIEKLLMECRKDMLDDSEDFDEYSDSESK